MKIKYVFHGLIFPPVSFCNNWDNVNKYLSKKPLVGEKEKEPQELYMKKYGAGNTEVVFYSYLIGTVYIFFIVLFEGTLLEALPLLGLFNYFAEIVRWKQVFNLVG